MNTLTIPEPTIRDDDLMTAEEFLDRELGPEVAQAPTTFEPRHSVPPAPHMAARDHRFKVLPRLLAMADHYLKTGAVRQALEMYFDLYQNHEGTPEADKASEGILEVARIHEENGELHLARAIYEQLI